MPRHDKTRTPPEKRRAPKGSAKGTGVIYARHTAESRKHLKTLAKRWRLSAKATVLEALKRCAERPD